MKRLLKENGYIQVVFWELYSTICLLKTIYYEEREKRTIRDGQKVRTAPRLSLNNKQTAEAKL